MAKKKTSSSTKKTPKVNVLSIGDLSVEAAIIPVYDERDKNTQHEVNKFLGGAGLISKLLAKSKRWKKLRISINDYDNLHQEISNDIEEFDYPKFGWIMGIFPKKLESKDRVYRIREPLGRLVQADRKKPSLKSVKKKIKPARKYSDCIDEYISRLGERATENLDFVVIHNRGLGWLESEAAKNLLENVTTNPSEQTVFILQAIGSLDFRDGSPEAKLAASGAKKQTILVTDENTLKSKGVDLRFDLSFEKCFSLLFKSTSKIINDICQFQHVIVKFRDGILHLHANCKNNIQSIESARFVFRNQSSVESDRRLGSVYGNSTFLICSLVTEIAKFASDLKTKQKKYKKVELDKDNFLVCLRRSFVWYLYLSNKYFRNGYWEWNIWRKGNWSHPYLDIISSAFVDRDLDTESKHPNEPSIVLAKEPESGWAISELTIFEDSEDFDKSTLGSFSRVRLFSKLYSEEFDGRDAAQDIVFFGFDHVSRRIGHNVKINEPLMRSESGQPVFVEPSIALPYVQLGSSISIDRMEIDQYLTIKRLARAYLNSSTWIRPLSIAVFGPPGSGKNYVIKQILSDVGVDVQKNYLAFNISQFGEATNLATAFHEIQDKTVSGAAPLVIFDEFDSNKFGYLKHFLAPMQDGQFYDSKGHLHLLGRAIFVFSGGVGVDYEDFKKKTVSSDGSGLLKTEDFISRLNGHINIYGTGYGNGPIRDEIVRVKRAVILRSMIETYLPEIVDRDSSICDIDAKVIEKFLEVEDFEHNVRSIESLLKMSRNDRPFKTFQLSMLPVEQQLKMHASPEKFNK